MLLLLVTGLSLASAAPPGDGPYRVLVLHSFRSSLPITVDWYSGIVRGFSSEPDLLVEIDSEAPDLVRFENLDTAGFADKQQLDWLLEFYRKNYQDRKPHLIMPTDVPALRFLLVHGEDLFPGVPIVIRGSPGTATERDRCDLFPRYQWHAGAYSAGPSRHTTRGCYCRILAC